MNKSKLGLMLIATFMTGTIYAQDLTGTWQQIDDKTGSPKALIEIRQDSNGTYAGKIVKVTPRPGYTPQKPVINVLLLIPISQSWGWMY